MDFLEIMDYCGYDLEEADKLAKIAIDKATINAVLDEVGLETMK